MRCSRVVTYIKSCVKVLNLAVIDPVTLQFMDKMRDGQFFIFYFFGVSRLQERNQATQCHPSKVPTREQCNLTDTTPRGAAQPSPRRMAMWATPSALPAESRIQGPAYAPVK
jgi:hypothetical protein